MYFYKLCAFSFMLIPIVTCDRTVQENDIRDVRIRRLLNAQKFNTGYVKERQQSETDLRQMSDKHIVEMEQLQYKRIKCSYLFNALIHLHLTRYAIQEDNPAQLRLINMNSISYVNQAVRMTHSLFRIREIDMSETWLLYAYAQKIRQYFSSIRVGSRSNTVQQIDIQLGMHDLVVDRLKTYTKSKCEPENLFDSKSTRCYIFKTHSQMPNQKYADITVRQVAVNENKNVLNDMMWENVAIGLNCYVGELFTDDHLYLFNVVDHKYTMGVFLNTFSVEVDWGNLLERIKAVHRYAKEPGINGIVGLLQYQSMFIDIFQTIILRITLKHITYLNLITDQINNNYDKYIKSYHYILNRLVQFLHIDDSPCFDKLLKYFQSELSLILKDKDSIISTITEELSIISKKLDCSCMKPFEVNYIKSKESINNINLVVGTFRAVPISNSANTEIIDDSLLSARAYLEYLKHIFRTPYTFEVVQSFNKLNKDSYLRIFQLNF